MLKVHNIWARRFMQPSSTFSAASGILEAMQTCPPHFPISTGARRGAVHQSGGLREEGQRESVYLCLTPALSSMPFHSQRHLLAVPLATIWWLADPPLGMLSRFESAV